MCGECVGTPACSPPNGLCLYPGQSLVQNIGMDGTGVHCGHSSYFEVDLSVSEWNFPDRIEESMNTFEAIRSFLVGLRTQGKSGAIVDLVSPTSRRRR